MTKHGEDFATLTEAARLHQLSRRTLGRLADLGRLPTFTHERDRRAKLVRLRDVEALHRPQPAPARDDRQPAPAA